MGYKYYASVTFPSSARRVKAIADYLDGSNIGCEVKEEGMLICVSDVMASNGDIPPITFLLNEHDIPYDHYHRDDNACKEWTEYFRINEANVLVEVGTDDEAGSAVSNFAKEVLKALEEGKTEEVYSMLNDAIVPAVEPLEELAIKFVPGQ